MTWWNTDWHYRREITIQENSGNNLTDYQIKIVLNSSNFDFSKANSDGSDIRFVDSDDTTPLSYWIEKWDSVNQEAIVWVKVPNIPASGTTTIYMYYGNPSATSESNGDATFEIFDHFEGTSLNTSKWNSYLDSGSSITVSDSIITFTTTVTGNYALIGSKTGYGLNYALRSRAKIDTFTSGKHQYVGFVSSLPESAPFIEFITNYPIANVLNSRSLVSTQEYVNLGTSYTGYRVFEIARVSSSEIKFYIDDSLVSTHTSQIPTGTLYVFAGARSGISAYVDWILVRKYTDPEPTYSIGAEEIVGPITLELTDGFQLTEIEYRVGVSKLATESISVSDVLSKQPSITKTESISVSDIFEKLPTKILTETSTLSDVISRSIAKGITETLSVSDVTTKSLQRLFEELSTLADYISKLTKKEFVETSQLIDSIQTIRKIVQEITETVSLSDVAYKLASKILQETETLTDIIKTRITAKSITETLTLQDIIAKSLSRIIAESIALADYVYKKPILTFTETISTTDYVTAVVPLIKNLWEYLSLTDYLEIKPAVTPPTLREMINLDKKMALKFITSTARYLEWRKERLT